MQAEQRLGQASTVTHAGVSLVAAIRQPQRWRGPYPARWTLSYP
jgi:hypothetical protein